MDAKAAFLECARSQCPSVVQRDCTTFADDVERRMPSILIAAKLADGSDVTRLIVTVDGKVVASANVGISIPLDPGAHLVRVTRPDGGGAAEWSVVVREAEKQRVIGFVFPPPGGGHAPPPPGPAGGPPVLAVVGGVGAVVSLGIATALVLEARGSVAALRRTCAPSCDSSTVVDPIRTRVGAAYLAGGLGVAFLALGAYGWLTWRATRTAVVVAPTTAGAVVFGSYVF